MAHAALEILSHLNYLQITDLHVMYKIIDAVHVSPADGSLMMHYILMPSEMKSAVKIAPFPDSCHVART